MFKFGFSLEDSENDINDNTNSVSEESFQWIKSNEIRPQQIKLSENLKTNSITCGDFCIKYITNDEALKSFKSDSSSNLLLNVEQSHSDLVTAVYEGGLKVWECTYDLLMFINDTNLDLKNKKVLDLGCGAGIIGIFASLKGSTTIFQDYNVEVINQATVPNIVLNCINPDNCAFYSGDWKSFLNLLRPKIFSEDDKFDYIFTSETIYNVDNYPKLMEIFTNFLKRNGTIYLAAKYYYFGVGGGIAQFEDTLKKNIFDCSTCWICSEGVKRAIIKITFK